MTIGTGYTNKRSYLLQHERESHHVLGVIDDFPAAAADIELIASAELNPVIAPRIRVIGVDGAGAAAAITAVMKDGQTSGVRILLEGTDAVGTVTFARTTNVKLGAATRILGVFDTLLLQWSAEASAWLELSFTVNS